MKCSRLLGLAAMAALFAIGCGELALAQKKTVIRSVPIGNLRILDPIWTTAYITRNHAYMIWDTLFALDADNKPQPQMVDTLVGERRQAHLHIHAARRPQMARRLRR